MKAQPHSSLSPYLRRPLRSLDEALSDRQAGEAFVRDVWYKFDPNRTLEPEPNHAAVPDAAGGP
jgi:hypothetical protein